MATKLRHLAVPPHLRNPLLSTGPGKVAAQEARELADYPPELSPPVGNATAATPPPSAFVSTPPPPAMQMYPGHGHGHGYMPPPPHHPHAYPPPPPNGFANAHPGPPPPPPFPMGYPGAQFPPPPQFPAPNPHGHGHPMMPPQQFPNPHAQYPMPPPPQNQFGPGPAGFHPGSAGGGGSSSGYPSPKLAASLEPDADPLPAVVLQTKVASWNVLAQGLIRRKMYPAASKDALHIGPRRKLLKDWFVELDADIFAMQEVDSVPELWDPLLGEAGYGFKYTSRDRERGESLHGLLVAWRRAEWDYVRDITISLDVLPGSTMKPTLHSGTGNIALFVELAHRATGERIVVSNHHLYWIPRGSYIRARQLAVVLRELAVFNPDKRPVLFLGDFNGITSRPEYSLLTHHPLTHLHERILGDIPEHGDYASMFDENNLDSSTEFANRPDPSPRDLVAMFAGFPVCASAYGHYGVLDRDHGCRDDGWLEPRWTTMIHNFVETLDYIHLVDPRWNPTMPLHAFAWRVEEILALPNDDDVLPGIPNDEHPSDHAPLMATVSLMRRVALVVVPSAALHGYMMHVLTTAHEEVMGLILGDWKELPPASPVSPLLLGSGAPTGGFASSVGSAAAGQQAECVAEVTHFIVQRRLDKRPDRVELAPEQLVEAAAEAERWSAETGRSIRVIGWYHSHPNITVQPSHVDVGTQRTQQLMDARFFGLIMSAFHAEQDHTQNQRLIAFQTDAATNSMQIVPTLVRDSRMTAPTLAMLSSIPRTLHSELIDEYARVAAGAPKGSTRGVVTALHHVTELVEFHDKVLTPAVTVAGKYGGTAKRVEARVVDDLIQF
ncbi:hypothetical protein H9P43_005115 [Blastocladiella emersonii ATCC 22665]|nr:hypothetical protein H9P43_005115 [Blastocladiella emersonii ATCC 22665]